MSVPLLMALAIAGVIDGWTGLVDCILGAAFCAVSVLAFGVGYLLIKGEKK
jgi:hypothetical protein